jgi:hypothetical protein
MALLDKRLIDYGTGTNQVHLGVVPDSVGSSKVALTDDGQEISGLKIFSEIVTSPNSPETLEEIEDNNEFVTYEQFGKYEQNLKDDFAPSTTITIPGVIGSLPDRWRNIVDVESGTLIGRIKPENKDPGVTVPPYTPPKYTIVPLPETPGQYVIPGVGPGGIKIIGGTLIIIR